MNLQRRIAREDDLELLFEINCAALKEHVIRNFGAWDEEFQRRTFRESTDPASHVLFYDGAKPVGFWSVVRNPSEIYLVRLSLLPAFQRQGVGSSLIRELIAEARLAALPLRLQVFLTNPARLLYERLGFRIVRTTNTHCHMQHSDHADH